MAALLLVLLTIPGLLAAKDGSRTDGGLQRYIIELQDPPLAEYDGRELSVPSGSGFTRLAPTSRSFTGGRKLNTRSLEALAYLKFIAERQQDFKFQAGAELGRKVEAVQEYRNALNGMAVDLSEEEAARLADSPLVKSIRRDEVHRLETYASPPWIGSDEVWDGLGGVPASQGEGIVVGIIDSGINWDHPSFADPAPGPGGYNHSNPFGQQIGLCSDPEVECNDKLIGVYDFVEDNPGTPDVEENTKGRDDSEVGHGTHVSSIAAGNPLPVELNDSVNTTVSGVAPRANLVSYRVCFSDFAGGGGCPNSAVLAAIDQAIDDGVDVLNYSAGSTVPINPWQTGSVSEAYLQARESGIFLATSAGNSGPLPATITSPADAPWMVAVGNSTHNVGFGSELESMVGGGTQAPEDMQGASLTPGTGRLVIVHAKDYGFPLCGTGESESQATCEGNTGESNPWAGQRPFNGEIVVCDRGTYGRVEKGKNLLLAGAGGYVLANTDSWGEALVADDHCLPAVHIGAEDGNELRDWLDSGSGHGGAISGMFLVEDDRSADQLAFTSSRGPNVAPANDVLKPNLIAPGTFILGADGQGNGFRELPGTSFSSPHIAGAAALLKSARPGWSVDQIASAIETTATTELAKDYNGDPVDPHDVGAGRPQLGQAARAALFLEISPGEFNQANPALGGDPATLNLPSMLNANCAGSCSFNRTLTDQVGGGTWTATAEGFIPGVEVSVSPENFTLGDGQSQELTVSLDLVSAGDVGDWFYGRIRLESANRPDQLLTVAALYNGGVLPDAWFITDTRNGGWRDFELSGLVELPNATFNVGGLQPRSTVTEVLIEDPTDDDPFDGGEGVFTVWHELNEGALWLYAETEESTAIDLDLYVGVDLNGNGQADDFEQLCTSISDDELERCDLYDLEPGDYWILVQNWFGTEEGGDEATLRHAAVVAGDNLSLAASGPGITQQQETFGVRLSWDNLAAVPGEQWLGAVGVSSTKDIPNNIGVIPVTFNRTGISEPETFPLVDGRAHTLAIAANSTHDRMFIDVPPGATSLSVTANRFDEEQNSGLSLELVRLGFEEALSNPPFATPPGDAPVVASADGQDGQELNVTVDLTAFEPGRWYAVLSNNIDFADSIEIRAQVEFAADPLPIHRGLWEPNSRPGINQGYEYHDGDPNRFLIWYTFDEDGQPIWFYSEAPDVQGNIWTSDVFRLTNDGSSQQLAPVGYLSVTTLAENDALFSFTLFGESGTDRLQPLSLNTCPQVNGSTRSFTGQWFPGFAGLGGASIIMNDRTQAQIHYIYDDSGESRWLVAQDIENPEPTNPEMPFLQFSGFCSTCPTEPTSYEPVGMLERSFINEIQGTWTLDYLLLPPLSGSVERMDQTIKLTQTLECE